MRRSANGRLQILVQLPFGRFVRCGTPVESGIQASVGGHGVGVVPRVRCPRAEWRRKSWPAVGPQKYGHFGSQES